MAKGLRVPKIIPSKARTQKITSVSAGDRIDLTKILGRPARGVKFVTTAVSDTVEYKLNSMISLDKDVAHGPRLTEKVWSGSEAFPVYTATGGEEHLTIDDIQVHSIEIISLSLSSGTSIELIVW